MYPPITTFVGINHILLTKQTLRKLNHNLLIPISTNQHLYADCIKHTKTIKHLQETVIMFKKKNKMCVQK